MPETVGKKVLSVIPIPALAALIPKLALFKESIV